MAVNREVYLELVEELRSKNITLVAVSKTKLVEDILALYELGQRNFGENYVQELLVKQPQLPNDINWHFIGHLQGNKVKYIVPFIHLIHGVDSIKLLQEINKQAAKINKVISCLLQVHIAREETKFGFNEQELEAAIVEATDPQMKNISVTGLMGMASFSDDMAVVRNEFKYLRSVFNKSKQLLQNTKPSQLQATRFHVLSMGMSNDYLIAVEEGSNIVRIGSLLFGARTYNQ